jgi:hypothetical protein
MQRRRLQPVVILVAVVSVFASLACGSRSPDGKSEAGSEHAHTAPHGGVLVELGEEFAHVELVLDRAAETLTAYVFDGEAERPIRVSAPSLRVALDGDLPTLELAPVASALTGETAGDTSQFAARHASLRRDGPRQGRLAEITVKGQVFRDVAFEIPTAKNGPRP